MIDPMPDTVYPIVFRLQIPYKARASPPESSFAGAPWSTRRRTASSRTA